MSVTPSRKEAWKRAQANHRRKMLNAGMVRLAIYVTPEEAEDLRKYLDELRGTARRKKRLRQLMVAKVQRTAAESTKAAPAPPVEPEASADASALPPETLPRPDPDRQQALLKAHRARIRAIKAGSW